MSAEDHFNRHDGHPQRNWEPTPETQEVLKKWQDAARGMPYQPIRELVRGICPRYGLTMSHCPCCDCLHDYNRNR